MSGAARFLPACSNLVIFIISLPILAIGLLCFTVLAVKLVQVGGNKGGSGEVSGLQIIV
ncbi:hypothetical protein CK203_023647 [Vitis vinifera]|uniref:Uncharacterized protein n=1 Tax=Vitis vinifera TaxID=29760 RepID=A0A438EAT1_VITVI|nr:hypothetical protein CK203_081826 [Vitis vinifera]RVX06432.1 hypothetical protein CK203_023647 [Vitis vinifera]